MQNILLQKPEINSASKTLNKEFLSQINEEKDSFYFET